MIEEAIGNSEEGFVRIQEQKDRIYFAVAQIVVGSDPDAVGHDAKEEGTANCDAKEGEKKDNGHGDNNLRLTDTRMEFEPNDTSTGDHLEAAHEGSSQLSRRTPNLSHLLDALPHQNVRRPLDAMLKMKDKYHI